MIRPTAPWGREGGRYYFNFTHQEVQVQGSEVHGPFGTEANAQEDWGPLLPPAPKPGLDAAPSLVAACVN